MIIHDNLYQNVESKQNKEERTCSERIFRTSKEIDIKRIAVWTESPAIYIYIYIYIYIVIHRQTASLYHNSSVWLDK